MPFCAQKSGALQAKLPQFSIFGVVKRKRSKMTFEEMYALACQRKKDMPEGKGTTELFKKGPHGIGKKLVEEAAESWMAARFESRDAQCLELSQVLYYVAVMMAEKGLTLEEVYAKL
jgi:phosphoribosyl-ATP pyrophosphohydrolase